jgi:hypothetical protein
LIRDEIHFLGAMWRERETRNRFRLNRTKCNSTHRAFVHGYHAVDALVAHMEVGQTLYVQWNTRDRNRRHPPTFLMYIDVTY